MLRVLQRLQPLPLVWRNDKPDRHGALRGGLSTMQPQADELAAVRLVVVWQQLRDTCAAVSLAEVLAWNPACTD